MLLEVCHQQHHGFSSQPNNILIHVKMRSPIQGLGSIPASKNGVLGVIPASINHVVRPIPQITSVMIQEQHFLSAGIESQNQKLFPLGSDAKF